MANNNDWVDVVNTPSKRRRDRAEEIAKDPMRERNYGPVRQDSGLAPLKEKTTWRTVKDTLRGLVGMSTKDEERRKKRQKENEKKLQTELQAQHDNKGGRRRTRRRRGGRRRRTRRRRRRTRRRRRRTRRRRRRRQQAGWICACGVGHEPGSACFLCGDAGPTAGQTVQAAIAIQRAARAKQARRDGKRGGRRRRSRRKTRRRRRQRGGFDPIPKFRYKPKVFLNASAPKEAPIPPKPWW